MVNNITSAIGSFGSLQTNIDGLYAQGNCAFIGTIYSDIVTAICTQIGCAFSLCFVCYFNVGTVSCVMAPLSVILPF